MGKKERKVKWKRKKKKNFYTYIYIHLLYRLLYQCFYTHICIIVNYDCQSGSTICLTFPDLLHWLKTCGLQAAAGRIVWKFIPRYNPELEIYKMDQPEKKKKISIQSFIYFILFKARFVQFFCFNFFFFSIYLLFIHAFGDRLSIISLRTHIIEFPEDPFAYLVLSLFLFLSVSGKMGRNCAAVI